MVGGAAFNFSSSPFHASMRRRVTKRIPAAAMISLLIVIGGGFVFADSLALERMKMLQKL